VSPVEGNLPLLEDWVQKTQKAQGVAVVSLDAAKGRSIKEGVSDALPDLHLTPNYHVHLSLSDTPGGGVRDAAHALAIAEQVSSICRTLCDQRGVRQIHLFVTCSDMQAFLIGQQFNALCSITLYEYAQNAYSRVGTLVS
jgi:hypothetical protein